MRAKDEPERFSCQCSPASLQSLSSELQQAFLTLRKDTVGPSWYLKELEEAALEAVAHGEGGFI